jgi:hypothetical protein
MTERPAVLMSAPASDDAPDTKLCPARPEVQLSLENYQSGGAASANTRDASHAF